MSSLGLRHLATAGLLVLLIVFVGLPHIWGGFPYSFREVAFALPIFVIGALLLLLCGSRHLASVLFAVPILVGIVLLEPRAVDWAVNPTTQTVYVAGTSASLPAMGTEIMDGRVICYLRTGSVASPSAIALEAGPTWNEVTRCDSTTSSVNHALRIAIIVSFGLLVAFAAYLGLGAAYR